MGCLAVGTRVLCVTLGFFVLLSSVASKPENHQSPPKPLTADDILDLTYFKDGANKLDCRILGFHAAPRELTLVKVSNSTIINWVNDEKWHKIYYTIHDCVEFLIGRRCHIDKKIYCELLREITDFPFFNNINYCTLPSSLRAYLINYLSETLMSCCEGPDPYVFLNSIIRVRESSCSFRIKVVGDPDGLFSKASKGVIEILKVPDAPKHELHKLFDR
jgi:hypothetical protein